MAPEQWKIAIQVFVGLGGTGLIVGIAKWFWVLGKRTENLERQFHVFNTAFDSLLQLIQRNGKLTKDNAQIIANSLKLHAHAEGNPITSQEADKLNQYIQWSREGKQFTPEQAQDFHQLAEKYRNDPKVLAKTPAEDLGGLLVLAGLIFAIYALASGKAK